MLRVLMIGYGSIGQGLTPLLFRHLPDLKAEAFSVITADTRGENIAQEYGLDFRVCPLTRDNYLEVLTPYQDTVDLLINVSVDVSSVSLIAWCQSHDVLYIDTCVEPWAGGYAHDEPAKNTNYQLREQALALKGKGKPTALVAHGANPGLVSHFLKAALLNLAKSKDVSTDTDISWGALASLLNVQCVHIAELDTQTDNTPLLPGEFTNTWSVDGLLSEAGQPAELGWGTHESPDVCGVNKHASGSGAGIYLNTRGADVKVKSWVPSVGEQEAYLITHHEALSIADFLSVKDVDGSLLYRPSSFYAYHPSDKTCASLEAWRVNNTAPTTKTVLRDTLVAGSDELGVLLVYPGGAYWYGSTLSLPEARTLVPYNNATSLQVTSTMLGAITWMLENRNEGVVEAEEVPHHAVLEVAAPYLGKVHGVHTTWQPGSKLSLQDHFSNTCV